MKKQELVILSAYTGFLLWPDLSEVHKQIERALCRPVYTHEIASDALMEEVREKLLPYVIGIVEQARKEGAE